jgi:hypothetical protein
LLRAVDSPELSALRVPSRFAVTFSTSELFTAKPYSEYQPIS